jgi:hypothetical protein
MILRRIVVKLERSYKKDRLLVALIFNQLKVSPTESPLELHLPLQKTLWREIWNFVRD